MTRPVSFDAVDYKHRNVVERFYSRMKNWRGLASRYDKARANRLASTAAVATLALA